MKDIEFDKEQAERINEFLSPEKQQELLNIINKGKYTKDNVHLLDLRKFSNEFCSAVDVYFAEDRVDGYQRLYIPEEDDDELFDEYKTIKQELLANGFTDKDLILVDNTW